MFHDVRFMTGYTNRNENISLKDVAMNSTFFTLFLNPAALNDKKTGRGILYSSWVTT